MKSRIYEINGHRYQAIQTECPIFKEPLFGRFLLNPEEERRLRVQRARRAVDAEPLLPGERNHLLIGRVCGVLGFTRPESFTEFIERCIERGWTQVQVETV